MKRYILLLGVATVWLASCQSYIDVVPDRISTIDNAFTDRTQAEKFLHGCYSQIPHAGAVYTDNYFDDMTWSHKGTDWLNQFQYIILRDGNNVTTPYCNNWNGERGGRYMFQAIRNCNLLLERIDEPRDMDSSEKARFAAEAKVLKAFYHYHLLQQYGPIPIIRSNLPETATNQDLMVYRDPVDDVVDYIAELIDEALPFLPLKIENRVIEMGRITQAAAIAIKAKALVLGASPLFNGNTTYAGLIDKRTGEPLISQEPSREKWIRAAEVCKAAIDTCHKAGHELYYFTDNSFELTGDTRKIVQVGRIVTDKWNPEHVWGYSGNNTSSGLEEHTIPPLTAIHNSFARSTMVPTLKAAELFYTENGVPLIEDESFQYVDRYDVVVAPDNAKPFLQPGVRTAALHIGREHRFYGSMGFDGGWWYGLGKREEASQWPINAKAGQPSGPQGNERYSSTAYYIKKLYNIESVYKDEDYAHERWEFPIIRLADLYLLYAEALNEALGNPNDEVYHYIDLVRERAGLAGVVESWDNHSKYRTKPTTYSGMQEIIRHERSIELAFEGHRLLDIRRWNIAPQEMGEPVRGWNFRQESAEDFYQVTVVDLPVYSHRDVLWPIKQSEITKNSNLVQNPGW